MCPSNLNSSALDDLISLLDINSHHGESVLLEADSVLFDEDSFRLSRRVSSGRTHANSGNTNSTSSSHSATANLNSTGSNFGGNSSESNEREATNNNNNSSSSLRKNSYRIRDQRWYESYRDELFSSSSSGAGSSLSNHHHSGQPRSHHGLGSGGASTEPFGSSSAGNVNVDKAAEEEKRKLGQFSFGESLQYWTDKVRNYIGG